MLKQAILTATMILLTGVVCAIMVAIGQTRDEHPHSNILRAFLTKLIKDIGLAEGVLLTVAIIITGVVVASIAITNLALSIIH